MVAVEIYESDRLEDFIAFWRRNADTDVVFAKDTAGALLRSFRVIALGQTVVIDRSGRVVYNGTPLDYGELKEYVDRII